MNYIFLFLVNNTCQSFSHEPSIDYMFKTQKEAQIYSFM